ncbi:MAG: hypothetical protein M3P18_09820 [Actinomycetota bacterium]|nr:hypothetical protein [Actinomycetota bacterium]
MTKARLRDSTSPARTITVAQDIIDTSTQRDSSHCMIAEAIKRALPEAQYISVDLATIRFSDTAAGRRYVYLTPRSAQQALLEFDQGEKPSSFKFRIEGAHVLATGSAQKAKASLQPNGRGQVARPRRVGGQAPPIGPLATGQATGQVNNRKGRRREFGLRAYIR